MFENPRGAELGSARRNSQNQIEMRQQRDDSQRFFFSDTFPKSFGLSFLFEEGWIYSVGDYQPLLARLRGR
jgi:hypothetical protein